MDVTPLTPFGDSLRDLPLAAIAPNKLILQAVGRFLHRLGSAL
jgi:hypothetical protein